MVFRAAVFLAAHQQYPIQDISHKRRHEGADIVALFPASLGLFADNAISAHAKLNKRIDSLRHLSGTEFQPKQNCRRERGVR
jgi:hypothetical protein